MGGEPGIGAPMPTNGSVNAGAAEGLADTAGIDDPGGGIAALLGVPDPLDPEGLAAFWGEAAPTKSAELWSTAGWPCGLAALTTRDPATGTLARSNPPVAASKVRGSNSSIFNRPEQRLRGERWTRTFEA